MAGLLGGLFGQAPDPKVVALDPETQGLIYQGSENAMRPEGDFQADINQGIERSGTLGANPSQLMQNAAGLGYDGSNGGGDIYNDALRSVYNQKSGLNQENQKWDNKLQAQSQQTKKLRSAAIQAMGQQRAATANFEMLTQAYNQNEMARAQFVSSLFQAGGTAYSINKMKPTQRNFASEVAPDMGSARSGGFADPTDYNIAYGGIT